MLYLKESVYIWWSLAFYWHLLQLFIITFVEHCANELKHTPTIFFCIFKNRELWSETQHETVIYEFALLDYGEHFSWELHGHWFQSEQQNFYMKLQFLEISHVTKLYSK